MLLFGLAMIYSNIHLVFLQKKGWEDRTAYEKLVTVFAIIVTAMLYLSVGTMP